MEKGNTKFMRMASSCPYIHESSYTTLRLALTSWLEESKVNIFLVDDDIFAAHKGKSPKEYINAQEWIEESDQTIYL